MSVAQQFGGDADDLKRSIETEYDQHGDDADYGATLGTIDSPYCVATK